MPFIVSLLHKTELNVDTDNKLRHAHNYFVETSTGRDKKKKKKYQFSAAIIVLCIGVCSAMRPTGCEKRNTAYERYKRDILCLRSMAFMAAFKPDIHLHDFGTVGVRAF